MKKSEIRVLTNLEDSKSVKEIAQDLDKSNGYISKIVSGLEEKSLLEVEKDGRRKVVSMKEVKSNELLMQIQNRYSHVSWETLLSGKAVSVLYYLDKPRSISEISEKTGDYRNTINRIVKRFRERGLVNKRDRKYELNEEFQVLNEFSIEYVRFQNRQLVNEFTRKYVIIWDSVEEILIQTREPIEAEKFRLTGPEKFEDYDIPLLTTDKKYYFYSEEEIGPEELICQTLKIDSGTRYQSYCLLLLEKKAVDKEELVKQAKKYGVKDIVENLVDYLETEGKKREVNQPSWNEFESMMEEYGVIS